MCEALRELMKDEIAVDVAKAKTEGRTQGKIEGKIESVRALMQNAGFSVEKAMEVIGVPKNEYDKYLMKL